MIVDRSPQACDLCNELRGLPSLFARLFLGHDIESRVVATTEQSWAITGLGALTPGYLLILPKRHVPAIGYLSEPETDDLTGLGKSLGEKVTGMYGSSYGNAVYFEHGSTNAGFHSGKSVDHAHLHILPGGDIDFRSILQASFEEQQVEGISDLRKLSKRNRPYLYFASSLEDGFAYLLREDIESQYLRRIWACGLGLTDEFDWRIFPKKNNVLRTLLDLKGKN